jgi:hypothetical protein
MRHTLSILLQNESGALAGGAGMRALLLAASLLSLFALAACGKKGPPSPPGPADQIIYPKGYPTPTPRSPSGTSPPAQWPFGITPSTEQP